MRSEYIKMERLLNKNAILSFQDMDNKNANIVKIDDLYKTVELVVPIDTFADNDEIRPRLDHVGATFRVPFDNSPAILHRDEHTVKAYPKELSGIPIVMHRAITTRYDVIKFYDSSPLLSPKPFLTMGVVYLSNGDIVNLFQYEPEYCVTTAAKSQFPVKAVFEQCIL